ncbi:Uncharacterised protein [Mycobacteroides abscessus subsp. abscessus]|uniref:Uncharacterized protein n=1 Tax=Mycobacteroides abscessus TaxID=36809 RepID=A0AB33T6G0_9MYCO|nr:hypothetical protein [Mycobacteroides abscessus]SHP45187.1 Uncharacterised protein [Mycobacteroides abscessus subsp. abscessus]SKH98677.1 Uncharacterised protein [Mycobacteroides abscessus subsp. massiliense]CPT28361.1 Uncharacterised protein [Mycobacteroides abscessus]CPT35648.1 Uncharacterised protein [Mycobacteroides abscessus]
MFFSQIGPPVRRAVPYRSLAEGANSCTVIVGALMSAPTKFVSGPA